jgi:SAM-dependent methyltransferase
MSRVIGSPVRAVHRQISWWMTRAKDIAHDNFYRTDTSAVVPNQTLNVTGEHPAKSDSYAYDPTPWKVLPRVLRRGLLPTKGFTFVDVGCGKGRIVLSALAHPFARVVGVEFSPYLCSIARKNLSAARFLRRRCVDAQIICIDAVEFPIPEAPLVFFFYNPFAQEVVEGVLGNIVRSYLAKRRPIYLIFYATSTHLPFISQFLKYNSDDKAHQYRSMLVGRRTVYVFELPGI